MEGIEVEKEKAGKVISVLRQSNLVHEIYVIEQTDDKVLIPINDGFSALQALKEYDVKLIDYDFQTNEEHEIKEQEELARKYGHLLPYTMDNELGYTRKISNLLQDPQNHFKIMVRLFYALIILTFIGFLLTNGSSWIFKRSPIWGVFLINVIFLMNTVPFIVNSVVLYIKCNETKSWQLTEGKIIQSTLATYIERDGRSTSNTNTYYSKVYRKDIRYVYSVEGKELVGENVHLIDMVGGKDVFQMGKKLMIAAYPVGKDVFVYYSPNNPKLAVLRKGTSTRFKFIRFLVLILLILIYFLVFSDPGFAGIILVLTLLSLMIINPLGFGKQEKKLHALFWVINFLGSLAIAGIFQL